MRRLNFLNRSFSKISDPYKYETVAEKPLLKGKTKPPLNQETNIRPPRPTIPVTNPNRQASISTKNPTNSFVDKPSVSRNLADLPKNRTSVVRNDVSKGEYDKTGAILMDSNRPLEKRPIPTNSLPFLKGKPLGPPLRQQQPIYNQPTRLEATKVMVSSEAEMKNKVPGVDSKNVVGSKPTGLAFENNRINASKPINSRPTPFRPEGRPSPARPAQRGQNMFIKKPRRVLNKGKDIDKAVLNQQITLPNSEEVSLKELTELSNIGLSRLMLTLVSLGGKEAAKQIPPQVLHKIRDRRKNPKGAMNILASTIVIPIDTAELLLLELGCTNIKIAGDSVKDRVRSVPDENTPRRSPIVVVMGHVDHGKTTLLDALRKTNIVEKEHGGITQSIAGFRVELPSGQSACFLDTPGHEAFASMRQSGTAVTDVACVVVAATDGVMPQTIESIQYARKAKLPIVFAITKTDLTKEGEGENSIMEQLYTEGLFNEQSDICVQVVAPKRKGLEELIEAILLQVESNLVARAPKKAPGEAVVLESRIEKALGPVADIVVRWGTLKVGDYVVCGEQWGKIRKMTNSAGKSVTEGEAGNPYRVSGFESCLAPGEDLLTVKDSETCKEICEFRKRKNAIKAKSQTKKVVATLTRKSQSKPKLTRRQKREVRKTKDEEFNKIQAQEEERRQKETRVILKADTEGSLQALRFAFDGFQKTKEGVVLVKASTGQISEADIDLAQTSAAYILGFNLKIGNSIQKKAREAQIKPIKAHPVLYNLLEEFSAELDQSNGKGKVKGVATVLKVFQLSGKDKRQVAGCRVTSGEIGKNDSFVVKRNGEIVAEVQLVDSLKILKKDVTTVEKGNECGVALKGFSDFKIGDIIEAKQQS